MRRHLPFIATITLFALAALAAGCNSSGSQPAAATVKTIASLPAGKVIVTLANADGALKKGSQEFTLTFTDEAGKPADVTSASLNFRMPAMGSMSEMNDGATLTTSKTPGSFNGKVNLDMAGDWQAMIAYEGPSGNGSITIPVVAK